MVVTSPWGVIALGAFVAGLGVVGARLLRAAFNPVLALGRAAVPLLTPLLVFVAAGVIKSSLAVQVAAGAVTAVIAGALLRPDLRYAQAVVGRYRSRRRSGESRVPFRSSHWSRLKAWARNIPAVLVSFAAFVTLVGTLVSLLGDASRGARNLFLIAVVLLIAAIVLRVIGYATTFPRVLVAIAVLVFLARAAVELGVLRGSAETKSLPALALVVGSVLVLTAAVEAATALILGGQDFGTPDRLSGRQRIAMRLETPVVSGPVTDWASLVGSALAVLSAFCLLLSAIVAYNSGGADEDVDRGTQAGLPALAPDGLNDEMLARMFSPVLLFTAKERWTPTPVDGYVKDALLEDWEGRTRTVTSVEDLPADCPGAVKAPCYELTQQCLTDDPGRCAEDLPDRKAVYVRVARRQEWERCMRAGTECADGSPNPFANPRGPWADTTKIILQYWYFYAYDEWIAPVAIGALKQVHAGDWEAITIGLSPRKPLWVAYSAHCAGTYAPWRRVRVAQSDPRRLRPLVAVAEGSHANYRVAEENRVPNFAECSGIFKDRLRLVSYAANIRDKTKDDRLWDPGPGDLEPVTAKSRLMTYPGEWGPYDRMSLANLRRDQRLGKDRPGPASPPLQTLWESPLHSIFTGNKWKAG